MGDDSKKNTLFENDPHAAVKSSHMECYCVKQLRSPSLMCWSNKIECHHAYFYVGTKFLYNKRSCPCYLSCQPPPLIIHTCPYKLFDLETNTGTFDVPYHKRYLDCTYLQYISICDGRM